ncbi:MAG: hypothetical protein FJX57_08450 [Alphaproteobacteria bacterium]|nr:hypothetical protein [Alphaproteobacteria bacterium]
MSSQDSTDLTPSERKLAIDALLTYGISLAALIDSERFKAQPAQRAKLIEVLLRTTSLLKRLGGQVPAEMEIAAAVPEPDAPPSHVH